MTADRPVSSPESPGSTKQKVIGIILILIFLFLAYMVYGMFSGGSKTPAADLQANKMASNTMSATSPGGVPAAAMHPGSGPNNLQPQMNIPQAMPLPKPTAQTEREAQLMKLQQETEAKYLAAVNELQMLKVEKDIAETNKAIMAAKFETVQSQKGIVDTLAPKVEVPPGGYGAGLVNPTGVIGGGAPTAPPTAPVQPQESYTVVSVSQLEYRWSAVLGMGGKLYNVYINDVLPPDGSKVVAIDKSGVILEKDGVRKKISLVSII